jgi:hypothetical protein
MDKSWHPPKMNLSSHFLKLTLLREEDVCFHYEHARKDDEALTKLLRALQAKRDGRLQFPPLDPYRAGQLALKAKFVSQMLLQLFSVPSYQQKFDLSPDQQKLKTKVRLERRQPRKMARRRRPAKQPAHSTTTRIARQ